MGAVRFAEVVLVNQSSYHPDSVAIVTRLVYLENFPDKISTSFLEFPGRFDLRVSPITSANLPISEVLNSCPM